MYKSKETINQNKVCMTATKEKHKEENSTALQKANMVVEICKGNKPCDIRKKEKKSWQPLCQTSSSAICLLPIKNPSIGFSVIFT